MKLLLPAYAFALFTIISITPHVGHYQRESDNPFQEYCAVVKMDYETTGIIGGNSKSLCNL